MRGFRLELKDNKDFLIGDNSFIALSTSIKTVPTFVSLSSKVVFILLCLEIKILSSMRHMNPASAVVPMKKPGWQYRVITSLSLINKPFLSFNTNQKPPVKSPKMYLMKNYPTLKLLHSSYYANRNVAASNVKIK